MEHLLHSVVEVSRLQMTSHDGQATYDWNVVTGMSWVPCMIDLMFQRPGKDIPMPVEAGKAPDRVGVFFCMPQWDLRAGDRVRTKPNEFGFQPVRGTFEIRVTPDRITGYAGDTHHIEVQVIEVSQALDAPVLATDAFPGTEVP